MTGFLSPRDLLRRRADIDGDRPAVFSPEGTVSFRDLATRASAAAATLQAAGVGPGVQVGLAVPNGVPYLVWFFGILEAGGIVVPLSPSAPDAEQARILADAGAGLLVSAPGPLLRPTPFPPRTLSSDPGTPAGIAIRQYTSGSAGKPRATLRTEAAVVAEVASVATTLGIGAGDRFLGVTPFHHAYGALSFLSAFPVGASVTALPRFLPGPAMTAARRDRPTFFFATPPMISVLGSCALSPGDDEAFRSLRHCVSSAGPLGKRERDAFVERFGVPVRVQYGSTETLATTVDLDDGFEEGRVGRPFHGVTVEVFDDDGRPLPAGTPGRVGVRSDAACDGYVDDPAGTADRFRDGIVFPGDRGVVDERGVLRLLGRDDIINVGGMKVDPVEVADAIRAALAVSGAVVLPGERAGLPAVVAFVEADPSVVTPAMVVEACRARLSSYKVPAHVEVMERFPRNELGKVVRTSLLKRSGAN